MNAPVEAKVTAATIGAGAGGVVATFVLWLLDVWVFHGAGVPEPVTALITVAVSAVTAYVAGWYAHHTPRPDLPTTVPPNPPNPSMS